MFRIAVQSVFRSVKRLPVTRKGVRNYASSTARWNANYSAFLAKEVQLEKEDIQQHGEYQGNVQAMEKMGFKVEVSGAECVLEKKEGGQTVHVSFNVNGSVPPNDPEDEDSHPISYPDFTVSIEKDDHPTVIEFECFFPETEFEGDFHFKAATVVSKTPEGQKTAPYFINSENVDPNMYQETLGYVQSLGLDAAWTDALVQLSTDIETKAYVDTLDALSTFVSK